MSTRILHGDCREVLRTLRDQSVHCCITSPPYWGLRSYLPPDHPDKRLEIGSEPTVHEWVRTMVEVFREVRRVLRDDGTLWLNLGDSYAGSRPSGPPSQKSTLAGNGHRGGGPKIHAVPRQMTASGRRDNHLIPRSDFAVDGLKPKDLVGQPWRLAFALQEDGWWLRQEIIWGKKNPMPESSRDRFTKAHEHVFLLSKSERYYFDFDAIQEPASVSTHARRAIVPAGLATGSGEHTAAAHQTAERHRKVATPKAALATSGNDGSYADGKSERMGRGAGWRNKNNASFDEAMAVMPATRNPRSVRIEDEDEYLQFLRWKAEQQVAPSFRMLSSQPFKGAHFATYPPALIEPFIKAGCPEGGTILDPFGGSGSTGLAADRLHRSAILIDLDERNVPMATSRIEGDAPLFADVEAQA